MPLVLLYPPGRDKTGRSVNGDVISPIPIENGEGKRIYRKQTKPRREHKTEPNPE